MKALRLFVAAAAFVATVGVFTRGAQACEGAKHNESAMMKPKTITIEQLAALQASKETYAILDANSVETRTKAGVIPGAKLLSHYETYDVSTELPADKAQKVVFYCGSTKCTAAPKAAMKAMQSGYTNVWVLDVGIKGWADAGKPTNKPAA